MRLGCNNFMKLAGFVFASIGAWYLGSLFAYIIPEDSLTATIDNIQKVGEKPILRAPPPKRQKCDHWSPCPPGSYAYRLLSGGGKEKMAKICFEDAQLISEEKKNAGRGINIAIVDYDTGKCTDAKYFDMWEGEFSESMTDFIKKAPQGSLLLMVTHDDGSTKWGILAGKNTVVWRDYNENENWAKFHQWEAHRIQPSLFIDRLKENAKKAIADLGSKEIQNIRFRSSWAFIAAKGFKLPDNIEKEKSSGNRLGTQVPLIIQAYILQDYAEKLQNAMLQLLQMKEQFSKFLSERYDAHNKRKALMERISRLTKARERLAKFPL